MVFFDVFMSLDPAAAAAVVVFVLEVAI